MIFQFIRRIKNFLFRKLEKINRIDKLFYINFNNNHLPVYWCDCNGISNFGDQLNPYLISKLSTKKIKYVKHIPLLYSNHTILLSIGSIIDHANRYCKIWGAGIMDEKSSMKNIKYYAVRGPRTQKRMLELGINPSDIIGDPALLLPQFYNKKVKITSKYGIVPHYYDFCDFTNLEIPETIKIIDITESIENVIDIIRSCDKIISSSLHGLIVANAYGIDCIWAKFSNKLPGDDVKFYDYFESVQILNAKPIMVKPNELITSLDNFDVAFYKIDKEYLLSLQKQLLESFPSK